MFAQGVQKAPDMALRRARWLATRNGSKPARLAFQW